MTEEIKEILEKIRETAVHPKLNYSSYDKSYNETIDNVAVIKSFACKQLLNYITNLQKENEELLKKLEDISLDEANIRADILLEQQDYKQRNEKAVELLQLLHYKFADGDSIHYDIEDIQKELQGGDE